MLYHFFLRSTSIACIINLGFADWISGNKSGQSENSLIMVMRKPKCIIEKDFHCFCLWISSCHFYPFSGFSLYRTMYSCLHLVPVNPNKGESFGMNISLKVPAVTLAVLLAVLLYCDIVERMSALFEDEKYITNPELKDKSFRLMLKNSVLF
ncbi:hypothetical protein Pint_09478 [Pistacia integerrima]|uniref:Uncharacterized protein n=1 Tax=Pistacia integerrima TaxID=434235 RepID=A0ACC0XGC0_9ROSI|nr:hypothetical protein Pint_09478 [Pistacia integerrima]